MNAALNRSRAVGVEYEMCVPVVGHQNSTGFDIQRMLAGVLTSNGIPAVAREYSHAPVPAGADFAVEHDNSVHGETRFQGITWHSVEIKSRILCGVDDWESVVPRMLDIARYMGARVNHSTGHHVHVSLPEVTARPKVICSLASLVGRIEPVIYGMIAPSRRRNSFCVPLGTGTLNLSACKTIAEYQQALVGQSRYYGLNLTHVTSASPRVEYRHHQGTLDPVKARHWLRLLLQITEHAVNRHCQSFKEPLTNDRQGFERMMTAVGFRVNSKIYRTVSSELSETASYLLRRWKHFNGQPARQPRRTLAAMAMEREVA